MTMFGLLQPMLNELAVLQPCSNFFVQSVIIHLLKAVGPCTLLILVFKKVFCNNVLCGQSIVAGVAAYNCAGIVS